MSSRLIVFETDMSATSRSNWIAIPQDCQEMSIALGWPGTDAPTGTLSLEVSGHGKNGTAGEAYPVTVSSSPAGTAGHVILDNIATSCPFICVLYTRSSGGTGAAFTNDSGVAGTQPLITFKGLA
jgi:hypothetical protein